MRITNEVECCCCDNMVAEILDHLPIHCSTTASLWKLFADATSLPLSFGKFGEEEILYPWFSNISNSWPMIVKFLEEYSPFNYSKVVVWNYLALGSFKCNKYGCSKGNAGRGALAFCVRNAPTNFVYAE
ncbi:hypothetical protein KY285_030579 [Solanum tuberosum]|nr:hypothetical protein KY285_030579 [Solanum tuberosum]